MRDTKTKILPIKKIIKGKIILLLFPAVLAYLAGCLAAPLPEARTDSENKTEKDPLLRIEAATAFYPYALEHFSVLEKLPAQVFMVSTNEAYEDLLSGRTDAIIVSAPSDLQLSMIEASDMQLTWTVLYKTPLAILVNPVNPVENLTLQELKALYTAPMPNWQDCGWENVPAYTYQLEEGNGSQTAFRTIAEGYSLNNYHIEIDDMGEILRRVAADPYGLCYSFADFYLNQYPGEGCKILTIDGQDIRSPEYPLQFEVYLIKPDTP